MKLELSEPRRKQLLVALLALGVLVLLVGVALVVSRGAGGGATTAATSNRISIANSGGAASNPWRKTLEDPDVVALSDRKKAPHIAGVTPVVIGPALATIDGRQFRATVHGSTTEYLTLTDRYLAAGSMFTPTEEQNHTKVVVLGKRAVDALFNGDAGSAINSTVRIGRAEFRVIGVLKDSGQDDVVVPLGAARAFLLGSGLGSGGVLNEIIVAAPSADTVPAALDEIHTLLDARHNIAKPAQRNYTTTVF